VARKYIDVDFDEPVIVDGKYRLRVVRKAGKLKIEVETIDGLEVTRQVPLHPLPQESRINATT
jgi:hypothetical protein